MKAKPVTSVVSNNNHQAVHIPKELRLGYSQVTTNADGEQVILTPLLASWVDFFEQIGKAPEAFMDFERNELPKERHFCEVPGLVTKN